MPELIIESRTHGNHTVLFDAEDASLIEQNCWHLMRIGTARGLYAATKVGVGGKRRSQYLHRLLLKAGPGETVDHINRSTLDNRRSNLRAVGHAENAKNSKLSAANTSGFKGVSFKRRAHKWVAQIKRDGRHQHLGYFLNPESAARAYDEAAIEFFGEYACTNVALGLLTETEIANGARR